MKPFTFPLVRLCCLFILGILTGHFFNVPAGFSATLLGICVFFSLLFHFNNSKISFLRSLSSIGLAAIFIILGCFMYSLHQTKPITSLAYKDNVHTFKITERLKPNEFSERYLAKLVTDSFKQSPKVLLYVKLDSTNISLNIDNLLIAKTTLTPTKPPLNPHQFNYQKYLKNKGIYYTASCNSNTVKIIKMPPHTLQGYAAKLRDIINLKLTQNNFSADALAFINALILGQRQDISSATYKNYTNAGVIHILAISGLHVGIILLILNFLLSPLSKFKYGIHLKTILLIFLLWGFAFIAGLSPSVCRAVTMFSVFAIGNAFKRSKNTYNTLAISAFILLLIQPNFLFEVGFQLSYLAVIGIVWFQPFIYKLFPIKWLFLNWIWKIASVTIAAQIGILPISLLYFHQFPGLFFVSNLVIIPFLGLLISFTLLVIILASVNLLPLILQNIFNSTINILNLFVEWIAKQDFFIVKHIYFGIPEMLFTYCCIVSFFLSLKLKSVKTLYFLFGSILLFQLLSIYKHIKPIEDTLLIFHDTKQTTLAKKTQNTLSIYTNSPSKNSYTITNYITGEYAKNVFYNDLNTVYNTKKGLLLVVDSLGVYNTPYDFDYILLTQSPKIHLKQLIDSVKPKLIIADGSNYKSYIKRWEATCEKEKLPFYYTGKKGAFILN